MSIYTLAFISCLRTGDIAGCRCIVDSLQDIYTIKEALEKRFQKVKFEDYIENVPENDDGYRALHLYVKDEKNEKSVEIQIRTKNQHNWATFVEIIDVIQRSRDKPNHYIHCNLQRIEVLISEK